YIPCIILLDMHSDAPRMTPFRDILQYLKSRLSQNIKTNKKENKLENASTSRYHPLPPRHFITIECIPISSLRSEADRISIEIMGRCTGSDPGGSIERYRRGGGAVPRP